MAGWISHQRPDDLRTTLNRRRLGRRFGGLVAVVIVGWLFLGPGRPLGTGIGPTPARPPNGPQPGVEADPTEVQSAVGTQASPPLSSSQRIIAIAAPLALPALAPGDAIALFGVATTDDGPGVAAVPLDVEALVLSVDPTSLTIVVPDHAVSAIFAAQAQGSIEIAVLPRAE